MIIQKLPQRRVGDLSRKAIIPDYAEAVKTYRDTSEFTSQSERFELSTEDAQRVLDSQLATLERFQSLDETEQDMNKGIPGDVKLAGPVDGEYTQAQFSNQGSASTLLVVENEPTGHYGATRTSFANFGPTSVESVQVTNNNGVAFYSTLENVEYQLSTDAPITIGGDRASATLTPQAISGYTLRGESS